MRLCEGRGRPVVPNPAEHTRHNASGHNTHPDSAGQDGKSGPSRRHSDHKEEALSNPCLRCLGEEPSSRFHERLLEPGTLSFLLQPFALFVAFVVNGRFRSWRRIPGSQMRNPKAARPCRGLQDCGTRAIVGKRPEIPRRRMLWSNRNAPEVHSKLHDTCTDCVLAVRSEDSTAPYRTTSPSWNCVIPAHEEIQMQLESAPKCAQKDAIEHPECARSAFEVA